MKEDNRYILIVENIKTKQQTVKGYFNAVYEALSFAVYLELNKDNIIHIYKLKDNYDYAVDDYDYSI